MALYSRLCVLVCTTRETQLCVLVCERARFLISLARTNDIDVKLSVVIFATEKGVGYTHTSAQRRRAKECAVRVNF